VSRAGLGLALGLLLAAARATPQAAESDPTERLDALLAATGGFGETTLEELSREVEAAGGIAFRTPVAWETLSREELGRYLDELFAAQYPPEQSEADRRLLVAFGLLPPEAELRALRRQLLLDNVVGFYDLRPERRRLYAVSRSRSLTPLNQVILAHELRHALQDQYLDLQRLLPEGRSDFDDRSLAIAALLEGDASFVMERFLERRLPAAVAARLDLVGGLAAALDGTAPVLRDQLVLPYVQGRAFVEAQWREGGWPGVERAWRAPPRSTEQVLHPAKFRSGEEPLPLAPLPPPPGARALVDGALGELLAGTLVADAPGAAQGWGGDRYELWDVAGRTLLVWRSLWDSPRDRAEYEDALRERLTAEHGVPQARDGFAVFAGAFRRALGVRGDTLVLVAADEARLLDDAVARVTVLLDAGDTLSR
jgi:hypothetical protein